MKNISISTRYALNIGVAAALAACGGSQPQSALPTMQAQRTPLGVGVPNRGSWMSPKAAKQDLIYVSDGALNSVAVYGLKSHELLGTLKGIDAPWGVCTDTDGAVWVVAWGDYKVIKYAHAGTKPLKILSEDDADLYDCAVDPTTGDLAVTNWGAKNWFKGNVLVYKHATGEPLEYTGPRLWFYYGCTYDDKGNLFADGWDSYLNGNFALAELKKGGKTLRHITLSPEIDPPILGAVRWDGKYVVVGNWKSLYEYSVNGNYATVHGQTYLTDHWPVGFFAITRSTDSQRKVIAPDQAGDPNAVQYWKYPDGGTPISTIKQGRAGVFGVAVSYATP
jgi:hypothetical protein